MLALALMAVTAYLLFRLVSALFGTLQVLVLAPPRNAGALMEGHRARRRFSQNFLHDRHYVDRIVAAIDPKPGERIVEIGPGLGALTKPLIERAGGIAAVEIDRDLAQRLRLRFPPPLLALIPGRRRQIAVTNLMSDLLLNKPDSPLYDNVTTPEAETMTEAVTKAYRQCRGGWIQPPSKRPPRPPSRPWTRPTRSATASIARHNRSTH